MEVSQDPQKKMILILRNIDDKTKLIDKHYEILEIHFEISERIIQSKRNTQIKKD